MSSGILYKSLGSSLDSRTEESLSKYTGIEDQSVPTAPISKVRVDRKQKFWPKQERSIRCRQSLKKIEEVPLPIKQASSPQLFTSDDDISVFEDRNDQTDKKQIPSKYSLRNQMCSKLNFSTKTHSNFPKITDKDRNEDKSLTVNEIHSDTDSIYRDAGSPVKLSLHPSTLANNNKFLNKVDAGTLPKEKCLPPDLKTPTRIKNISEEKQGFSGRSQTTSGLCNYQRSDPPSQSGRLKSYKDVFPCTSTPTEKSRIHSVLRKGSYMSSPSLEHSVSPFPHQTSMVVEERSSVFESPDSLRELCNSAPYVCKYISSGGSNYETCMTSTKESNEGNVQEIPGPDNKHATSCEKILPGSRSNYSSEVKSDHRLLKGTCNSSYVTKKESDILAECQNQTSHTTPFAALESPEEKESNIAGVVSPVLERKAMQPMMSKYTIDSFTRKRGSVSTYSSPCLKSPGNSRQENLHFQETGISRASMVSEEDASVILKRNIVNRNRRNIMQDIKNADSIISLNCDTSKSKLALRNEDLLQHDEHMRIDASQVSSIMQSPVLTRRQRKAKLTATENSISLSGDSETLPKSFSVDELTERLRSTLSRFSITKESPMITRGQRRARLLSQNSNLSSVSQNYSPRNIAKPRILTGKLSSRRSRLLSSKAYITTRNRKTSVRNREDKFSDISIGSYGERSPFLPSGIRRAKLSANMMINRNHDTVSSHSIKESESPKECVESDLTQNNLELASVPEPEPSEPLQLSQDLKDCDKSIIKEPSSSSPSKQECVPSHVQNTQNLSPLRVETKQQFQHFSPFVKPGKNWRRSLRSMAVLQVKITMNQ